MFYTKSQRKRLRKTAYLADKLPVFALEKDKVILRDGRVAVGFRVQGAPLESWTEGDYGQANEVLTRQLKMLPVGTVVQKTDIYFDREYQPDKSPSAYYESKLYDHFFARLTLLHEGYLFLSFPSKSSVTRSKHRFKHVNPVTSMFSQRGALIKNPFSGIEELLVEAESLAGEFVKGLFSLKEVTFTRLQEGALNELLIRYLNLSFNEPCTKLNREIYNDLSGLVVGEKKANVITMTGQGSEVFTSIKNHYGASSHDVHLFFCSTKAA